MEVRAQGSCIAGIVDGYQREENCMETNFRNLHQEPWKQLPLDTLLHMHKVKIYKPDKEFSGRTIPRVQTRLQDI